MSVSVIVPTYARADFLEVALGSIDRQTHPALEVIVVDDASPDDEPARVAAAHGAQLIRHDTNRGVGAARATGAARAQGDWIAFLDSDDEWLPSHLETLWTNRHGVVLVASQGAGTLNGHVYSYPGRQTLEVTSPAQILRPSNLVANSGTMVRRDAFHRAGGIRPLETCEDLDLWVRVLECGRGRLLPHVTFRYHQHEEQATSRAAEFEQGLLELLETYRDRPWWDNDILKGARTAAAWDKFRRVLRTGRLFGAARTGAALAEPVNFSQLVRLLRYRRACRRAHYRAQY
ncbi:MAG TPA: glycosyltransferase family 2 protein [Acidimicrobiales bacterium]|nr:glycosyltransferase family 2 protein [Acidimicrobiales bacterium]